MKIVKKLILAASMLVFVGCTAINNYVGNGKIEKGIASYNQSGTTPYSISEVIDGLELSPESALGVENLKIQFRDINSRKDSIVKLGVANTFGEIQVLHAYLRTAEKLLNLYVKVPTLKGVIPVDGVMINSERGNIGRIVDRYVLNENTTILNRKEKILKIGTYKDLSRNLNSQTLVNKIAQLEREVTLLLFVTSSVRGFDYDLGRIDVDGIISNSVEKNRGGLPNYVFLEGYVRRANYLPPNAKLVSIDIDYLNTDVNNRVELKKDPEGKIIEVTESKTLTVRGNYYVEEGRGYYGNSLKPININRSYQIKYIKGQTPSVASEREEISKIMDEYFSSLVRGSLPDLF